MILEELQNSEHDVVNVAEAARLEPAKTTYFKQSTYVVDPDPQHFLKSPHIEIFSIFR